LTFVAASWLNTLKLLHLIELRPYNTPGLELHLTSDTRFDNLT